MANKILIIDDEKGYLEIMKELLETNYYKVVLAENGREGLDKARETAPDLILLDIMMPDIDGFELLNMLKNDEKTRTIPVIILTAKSDTGSMLESKKLGATEYIIKPYDARELLNLLKLY